MVFSYVVVHVTATEVLNRVIGILLLKIYKYTFDVLYCYDNNCSRLKTELLALAFPTNDRSAFSQHFWFTMTMWQLLALYQIDLRLDFF